MGWIPPRPPRNEIVSRIEYWQALREIPESEPGAAVLRAMAAERLLQLGPCSEPGSSRDPGDAVAANARGDGRDVSIPGPRLPA
jgi:hypothetical protein